MSKVEKRKKTQSFVSHRRSKKIFSTKTVSNFDFFRMTRKAHTEIMEQKLQLPRTLLTSLKSIQRQSKLRVKLNRKQLTQHYSTFQLLTKQTEPNLHTRQLDYKQIDVRKSLVSTRARSTRILRPRKSHSRKTQIHS